MAQEEEDLHFHTYQLGCTDVPGVVGILVKIILKYFWWLAEQLEGMSTFVTSEDRAVAEHNIVTTTYTVTAGNSCILFVVVF